MAVKHLIRGTRMALGLSTESPSALQIARTKLILASCAYVGVEGLDAGVGCSYDLLAGAVNKYRMAVKEEEKIRKKKAKP
jgi:hypothetical protein